MGTYAFRDVQASIVGPGGSFQLGGDGAANSEEGVSVAMTEEKNTMTIGADGEGMHSLHSGKSGKLTVRLLKTSPINAKLSTMYNAQTVSSAAHGLNTISIRNPISGDSITATEVAFAKHPDIQYAKEGGMVEWEFQAIKVDLSLGGGLLANLATFLTSI